MTSSLDTVLEPIPISLVAGRYLLFDINVITYLRRTHHICGVLIGSIPQIPQQNVFLGLPVELLPEEARLLIEKEVAYIVDDSAWHKQKLSTLEVSERKKYLRSLRNEGIKARKTAEEESRKRQVEGLARQAARRARDQTSAIEDASIISDVLNVAEDDATETSITHDGSHLSSASLLPTSSPSSVPYFITPTTTYTPLSPQNPSQAPNPPVPSSYALFAHLHSRDYFITPGLRFGCDYTVYPGDPLRFHSHFLAVGYGWNEDIPMLDLVGGGRLGTGVKKAFLIGGEGLYSESEKDDEVRTFCLEWGGM